MAEPHEQPKTVSDNPQPAATDKPTELPHFQSPPLSPELKSESVRERIAPQPLEPMRPFASAPKLDSQNAEEERIFALPHIEVPKVSMPRFAMPSYLQRTASLAATVLIAAGLGAAFASAMNKQPKPEPQQRDAVLIEENAQLQKSVARLTKELAALKTTVETTSKESAARFARLNDRLDKPPETTGSISKQAVVVPPPAPPTPMPATEPTPLPQARPVGVHQERRPLPIIQGWTIYQIRNGVAWVDNGGELFAAQVGAPLPGLGPVEAVRREGAQWIVVTPKGVISSAGESTAADTRPKPYYPPYYRAR
jgi:hypothetical protein